MQSSIIVKILRLNLNKMIAQTWTFFFKLQFTKL